MTLRIFNEKGINEFRLQIEEIKSGLRKKIDQEILTDELLTENFDRDIDLENIFFSTKKEISIYLVEKLNMIYNKDLYYNTYLWSWVTAFYFDIVCPPKSNGVRKVNEIAKYILSDPKNWRRYYRHLLACSARLYCELGHLADAFLTTPIHIWGDFS